MNLKIILPLLLVSVTSFSNIEKERDVILKDLEKQKSLYKNKDKESRKIRSLIYENAKKLEKLNDQEREIREEILLAKSKVSESISGLKFKQEVIQEQRKKILKRLRLLSVWHKAGLGDLFFSSKSVKQLDKRMFFLRKIMASDADKLLGYSSDVRTFDSEKNKLRKKIKNMAQMKRKLKVKQSEMKKISRYHKNLLAKVYKQRKNAYGKLAKMREKSFKMFKELSFKGSFFELKGKLPMPIRGKISQKYGVIPFERKRVSLYSNGIKIRISEKQRVKAVSKGKVVFAEKMRGYGRTVVIDHGDRYYTVYANLSRVFKSVGEEVSEGDSFAEVKLASSKKNNYLYFELRKFSEALNPEYWIKKEDFKIALNQENEAAM